MRTSINLAGAAVCFVLFGGTIAAPGCGGGEEGQAGPGGGGGGGEGGGSTVTSGSGQSTTTAGSGGAGSGGSGEGGAGTGGSGGGGSQALYPLGAGYTWTYNVTSVNGGSLCDPGTHETTIVSTSMLAGRDAYEIDSFCTSVTETYFLSSMGDQVDIYENAAWALYIDPTLKEGYSWMSQGRTYTWHNEGKVTVPAGTFDDCWTAQEPFIEGESYTTYCRGVGPVKIYLAGGFVGSGYDAVLTQANFL